MSLWEANVRMTDPYTPGEQPRDRDVIKLNTNENPYPPSPKVEEALRSMDVDLLRRYPDPSCTDLVRALAEVKGLDPSCVFTGVGSDDVLAMSFLTFFYGKEPVLFADITYSFYDVWANLFRIPYRIIPLDDHFSIRPSDYAGRCGGVVIANPNAPTGKYLPPEEIEKIVSAHPECVVIVDEAYIDFGGESVVPLIHRYDNLLVVQTLSKSYSMAGMRVGAAFGCPKLISYLGSSKYAFNSYTMNMPSLLAGTAAVRDREYFDLTRKKIIATRERVKPLMRDMGFTFEDSMTNFLFVSHEQVQAKEIFERLRNEKIYVRYWDRPRISNHLRISIGTDEQMDTLTGFLSGWLGEKS